MSAPSRLWAREVGSLEVIGLGFHCAVEVVGGVDPIGEGADGVALGEEGVGYLASGEAEGAGDDVELRLLLVLLRVFGRLRELVGLVLAGFVLAHGRPPCFGWLLG